MLNVLVASAPWSPKEPVIEDGRCERQCSTRSIWDRVVVFSLSTTADTDIHPSWAENTVQSCTSRPVESNPDGVKQIMDLGLRKRSEYSRSA